MLPQRDSLASRILSVALSLAMVVGGVPAQAWAEAAGEAAAQQEAAGQAESQEGGSGESNGLTAKNAGDSTGEKTGSTQEDAKKSDDVSAAGSSAEKGDGGTNAGTTGSTGVQGPSSAQSEVNAAPRKKLAGAAALAKTMALADAGEPAGDTSSDPAKAKAFVEDKVLGYQYVMTNATRGDDGTFVLAAKTVSYGNDIKSLTINTSGDSDGAYTYRVTCDDPALTYSGLSRNENRWTFDIKYRPTDQHVITLTISVYAAGTARADITASKATAITTVPVRVILAPAPAKYDVTFSPVDAVTSEAVTNASLEVREGYSWGSTVSVNPDGTYTLDSSKSYYVKASAAGYHDATLEDFSPKEAGTTTLKLVTKAADTYTVSVTDATTGQPIEGASVKVTYTPSGSSYSSSLTPQADGTYRLEQGTTYTITASADGYKAAGSQKVTPQSTGTATTGTVSFTLTPITYTNVTFRAVDSAGDAIENAGTPTVKDGDSWDANIVQPEVDGSYRLEVGSTASVTYAAAHYRSSAVSYTVTGQETGPVDIASTPKENVLTVCVLKAKGVEDAGATVKVTHEEEDDWSYETETVTDSPNADGTYTLALPYSSWSSAAAYTITVTGSDGTTKTQSFTPSADSVFKTLTIRLYDDPDQAKADAVAKAIGDLYALRPSYGTDTNINDMVAAKLGDVTQGATISVSKTDTPATISRDGTIHYVTSTDDAVSHVYSKNVDLTFLVTVGDCTATADARATVGWDGTYFHQQMQAEADSLDVSALLNQNPSADQVTAALSLPERTTTSIWDAYSTIEWTAEPSSAVDTSTGEVKRGSADQTVALTATFKPNDSLLNEKVDKAATIGSVTKTYTVTIKADPEKVAAEKARLEQSLTNGFQLDKFKVFGSGENIPANGDGITSDLQMPRPGDLGVDGKYYSVTYGAPDGSGVSFNGSHAIVIRPLEASKKGESPLRMMRRAPASSGTASVPITCTITSKANPEITASQTLYITIAPVSAGEIDAEVALMGEAEAGYKDALLNGQSEPAAQNLSTFQELYAGSDGSLGVARNVDDAAKIHGIVTCDVDGYDSMGSYDQARTFKSSSTDVVLNEILQLAWNADRSTSLSQWHAQPQYNTAVAITSKLASERFGAYYAQYKDDPTVDANTKAKLLKLAPHNVSATINVAGRQGEAPVPQVKVTASVIGVDAFGSPETWASESSYTVDEGSSATAVSKRLFADAGLAVNGYGTDYGYYLDSIVSPDTGESMGWDATTGRYWQLFVNGVAASTGSDGVQLNDGDSVVWCYSKYGDSLPEPSQKVVTAKIRVVGPDASGKDANWVPLAERTVVEGTTAAQLTEQILRESGLDHDSGTSGWGYFLSTITSPYSGEKLGWDEGTGKYWQLFVNGVSSDKMADGVTLKAGDVISWQYSAYGAAAVTPTDVAVNPDAPRPKDVYTSDWPNYKGSEGGATTAATPTKGSETGWTQSLKGGSSSGMDYANCSDPIIVNGYVYQAVNSKLQIRDAKTGELAKEVGLAGSIGYFSRIAYADGLVLVPLEDGRLEAWTAWVDKPVRAWITPSLSSGKDVQHSYSTILIRDHHAYYGTTLAQGAGGWLCSVDLADGAMQQVKSDSGYYWSGFANSGDNIVVAEESGLVTLRNTATLAEVSHLDLSQETSAGVTASSDGSTAFVVTRDGVLHKLAIGASGSLKETGKVKFANYSTSTPALVGDKIYVGGGSKAFGGTGGIYQIDAGTLAVVSCGTMLSDGSMLSGAVMSAPLVSTQEGGPYVYFTSNALPGGIFVWKPGQSTVTRLYMPDEDNRQFTTSSVICDAEGNLYYANDSSTLFKVLSGKKLPSQTGNTPRSPTNPASPSNPTNPAGNGSVGGNGSKGGTNGSGNNGSKSGGSSSGITSTKPTGGLRSNLATASGTATNPTDQASGTPLGLLAGVASDDSAAAEDGVAYSNGMAESATADGATATVGLPVWPIVGMALALAALVLALVAYRGKGRE